MKAKSAKYWIVKEVMEINDKEYITYGIKSENNVVHDVSTDCGFVCSIVDAMNENCVSEIHLQDIVEDFLN